jgi:hypothetical protein
MTEQKTHFKKLLNPMYLGSHDLDPTQEYKVTIERIERDIEVIGDGGKKQKKAIAHFKGASKPMILNATNMKMIAKVSGSKFIEDWIGKTFILKVTQERSFGEIMDVVRILNKQA